MLSESLHQELIDLRQRVAEQAARLTHLERQLLHFQQATPTLEAVHQKLSVLWQQSPIAIIEWNTTFEVVDWNPTAEKLLGYSKQEAMGRPVTALLTLEDSHQATSTWLHQPNGDGVRHGTITKDGRVIACDWLSTPLLNAQEQVTGIVSLVRACSEDASPPLSPLGTSVTNQAIVPSPSSPLQTAPADISSVFLSDIINATVDPLFVKDEQHRYIILNKPYCEFMGWNHADVIGLNDHEIFPDTQQADFFRDIDQAMLTSGSDREDEETLTNLDGITHIFSTKKAYLRDASGKSFIIGTMRDITALKAAEAALKQSKEELEIRVEARTVELQQTVLQLQQEIHERQVALHKRDQAESKLQYIRKFLESVLRTLPVAVIAKEAKELRYVLWNPAAEAVLGATAKDVMGKNAYDLLPQEQAEALMASDRQVLQTRDILDLPEELVPADGGETRILHTKKTAVFDEDGNPQYLLAITEDITERKKAEAALQQNEAQLRALAQREELLNRVANQIRSSLDLDTILQTTVHEVRNLLQIDRCSFCWYHPESEQLANLEFTHESRGADFPSFLGTYPQDLSKPADRHNPVVESLSSQTPYFVDDVATDPHLKPEARDILRFYNYHSELLLPVQILSGRRGGIHCGHHSAVRPWSEAEIELLQAVASQLAIAINQAELYHQSVIAANTAQQQTQQLEEALQELQEAQAQMVQSEKMSSLGQLVAGVAHEINNPVNFIYGNLTYANEYIQDLLQLINLYQQQYPTPTKQIQTLASAIDLQFVMTDLPKLLTSMKVGADRIQQIVASLRTFSRMDEAEFKAVNIHEGIDSTLMILQSRLKAQQMRLKEYEYARPAIEVVKAYGNLPLVECYAGQLNQVFMNVLSNAIDALDERDSQRDAAAMEQKPSVIRIRTEVCKGDRVLIAIADNGPGIPEAARQKLFDPFFTTKPVGKGTGMGLSISYQIITERHGGSLHCHSSAEEGTEFLIEIPLKQVPQ